MATINEEELVLYKSCAEKIRTKYEINLKSFSKTELECADFVFGYKRFKVKRLLNNVDEKDLIQEEVNQCTYLCKYFGISNEANNLDTVMKIAYEKAMPVLLYLNELKNELKITYSKFSGDLFHSSSVNFEKIKKSVNQVNMYRNWIGDAVFASSDIESMYLYFCRSCGIKMYAGVENVLIYIKNPFRSIDCDKAWLSSNVWLYSLPMKYFEPVIDFFGCNDKYNIPFNHEWISLSNDMSVLKKEIAYIPLDKIRNYRIYECEGDAKRFEDVSEKLYYSNYKHKLIECLAAKGVLTSIL